MCVLMESGGRRFQQQQRGGKSYHTKIRTWVRGDRLGIVQVLLTQGKAIS